MNSFEMWLIAMPEICDEMRIMSSYLAIHSQHKQRQWCCISDTTGAISTYEARTTA